LTSSRPRRYASDSEGSFDLEKGDASKVMISLKSFAAANNEFAVGLYHELEAGEGNLFLSPFSVRSSLAMAYAGARGHTAYQMAEVLRLPGADAELCRALREFQQELASRAKRDAVEIDIANGLWRQEGMLLLAPYADMVRDSLGSELFEADFTASPGKAIRAINSWVNKKTKGRIPELFRPGDFAGPTTLVLANAVYFNGRWALPFPKFETRLSDFYPGRGGPLQKQTVKVPMMYQGGVFRYGEFEGFDMLEMLYRGNELSMVVLLPSLTDGWMDLEKKLTAAQLSDWIRALRVEFIDLFLPRFRVRSSFILEDTLRRMGMGDAFSTTSADFTGMTPDKPMGIGAVRHATEVEVDEAGARAIAATGICLGRSTKPVFRADHPFLFMIRDIPTDAILFMGRVLNPAG